MEKSIATYQSEAPKAEDLTLSLDAFIRSVAVRLATAHAMFLGAGASVSSGVPSAEACIWEWKRSIFATNNPGLEDQFSELSLPSVRERIQSWLDRQGGYPALNSPEEYSFYIQCCYPISGDRRAYFQEKIRAAKPHVGYHMLCHLAQAGFLRSTWSTNFDGLVARASAGFKLTALEVGLDTQQRLARQTHKGEILCVSLHGDYRYDELKNTSTERQEQEARLRSALIDELQNTPLIVAGYSGRDESITKTFEAAYAKQGTGALYWCGFSAGDIPDHVARLIRLARAAGRDAFYVPSFGFDDLMTRLALHCLEGFAREAARESLAQIAPKDLLTRSPFQINSLPTTTLIKSNAFEIECPSELLQFDLKSWPDSGAWAWLRKQTAGHSVVAVPLKGKILAVGLVDDVRDIFKNNVKGEVEHTPIAPEEYRFEDGAIVGLMRDALTASMASAIGISSERSEMWLPDVIKTEQHGDVRCIAHPSVVVLLRRIGGKQYLVLKPSLKVVDSNGDSVPREIADPIKLKTLSNQYNKPFNQAMNRWRRKLFTENGRAVFEYPHGCGSTFRFKVFRSPIFAEIGKKSRGAITPPEKLRPLLKHRGLELSEPRLLFSNRQGSRTVTDTHPIRGVVMNRPYDFPLTSRGFLSAIKVAIVCPRKDAHTLASYLANAQSVHKPRNTEKDYLIDYPGFQQAYGLPLNVPQPADAGWVTCPQPTETDPRRAAVEIANQINNAIQSLQSSYAPQVILIFFPTRWNAFRGYRSEHERFDVHDFVKAFCVQRGVATQFLNESTLSDQQQCRVWWWLSLALYVKGMLTPWVLDDLGQDSAFVGLGFSIDRTTHKGRHVVLGCSHIYSDRGEGLQYRLSKVEDPIMRGRNPFMSKDDARRVGEMIRELFYESRAKLPRRVVLHKRTPFLKDESEGLLDGLGGVQSIDMLEIQTEHALRYVASVSRYGRIDEDNYPIRRGTTVQLDDYSALLWVHGATQAVNPKMKYFQGKRRIPAPLIVRRHVGHTDLAQCSDELLGLSKMNWNTFDLYTKDPATLHSSTEIARIGSLLQRFGSQSYDYRLFI